MVNVIENTDVGFPIENAWVFGLLILDLTIRLQKPSFWGQLFRTGRWVVYWQRQYVQLERMGFGQVLNHHTSRYFHEIHQASTSTVLQACTGTGGQSEHLHCPCRGKAGGSTKHVYKEIETPNSSSDSLRFTHVKTIFKDQKQI